MTALVRRIVGMRLLSLLGVLVWGFSEILALQRARSAIRSRR